ncbi:MAG: thymidylate synthase complementing protein [Bacteriophage sp.]|nr:MAG: thymidylate synthase complementing protein [Bacteriophage sp.]
MKIIEPKVELWKQGNDTKAHVARCARVCYGKETGNDTTLIKRLLDSKHWSMFRHESVYAIIPIYERELENYLLLVASCPYIQVHTYYNSVYIATNEQFILDKSYPKFIELINMYRVTEDEFSNTEIGFNMMRYTFCVDTQISTSRELNRVSPNSIAEMSTRYVYEDGSICRPHWLNGYYICKDIVGRYDVYKDGKRDTDINHKVLTYIESCDFSFAKYKYLVEAGLHRQDARGVLPLDTATRCIYTYSINEYRHIIDLRYYGTTGAPHPNARLIASMIRNNLMELGYDFRD